MTKRQINAEVFKFLKNEHDFDINNYAWVVNGYTPLEECFYRNNLDAARALLENGFRITAINKYNNPLMCVVCMKNPRTGIDYSKIDRIAWLELCREFGADVNDRSSGTQKYTPLQWHLYDTPMKDHRGYYIIDWLLDAGAEVSEANIATAQQQLSHNHETLKRMKLKCYGK